MHAASNVDSFRRPIPSNCVHVRVYLLDVPYLALPQSDLPKISVSNDDVVRWLRSSFTLYEAVESS